MARRAQPLRPPSAPRPERVAAFKLGLSAESRAAMFLIAKGYRILGFRLKTPQGEIDLLARKGAVLAVVEVVVEAAALAAVAQAHNTLVQANPCSIIHTISAPRITMSRRTATTPVTARVVRHGQRFSTPTA